MIETSRTKRIAAGRADVGVPVQMLPECKAILVGKVDAGVPAWFDQNPVVGIVVAADPGWRGVGPEPRRERVVALLDIFQGRRIGDLDVVFAVCVVERQSAVDLAGCPAATAVQLTVVVANRVNGCGAAGLIQFPVCERTRSGFIRARRPLKGPFKYRCPVRGEVVDIEGTAAAPRQHHSPICGIAAP